MSDSIPEEMLSAYLDGELSEVEIARVEQLLETDADSRQLLGELQQIRDAIKSLPQQSLSPNFASRIVDQIQTSSPEVVRDQSAPAKAPNRSRMAILVATLAATILIGAWGVNFLPAPQLASQPQNQKTDSPQTAHNAVDRSLSYTPSGNDDTAEDFDLRSAPLDDLVSSESVADNSVTYSESDTVVELAEAEAAIPTPSAAPNPRDVTTPRMMIRRGLGDAPRMRQAMSPAVPSSAAPKLGQMFGLVVDYDVDANQSAWLEQTWEQWKAPDDKNAANDASVYVIEGTHVEIANLLAQVNSSSSQFSGPSMQEFNARGLSLYPLRQQDTRRKSLAQSVMDDTVDSAPDEAERQDSYGAPAPTANKKAERTASEALTNNSLDKSSNRAKAAALPTKSRAVEPRIRVLVRVRTELLLASPANAADSAESNPVDAAEAIPTDASPAEASPAGPAND